MKDTGNQRLIPIFLVFLLVGIPAASAQIGLPIVVQSLEDQNLPANTDTLLVDLASHIGLSEVSGAIARFSSNLGEFDIELLPDSAPDTVQNFLNYVNDGDYVNSFFHRSVPGFIVQAGGFTIEESSILSVPVDTPVVNEFSVSNTRGTVAMAKMGGDPNSATSQWFFNLEDNSGNLDNQNGGFTVFARVIGNGMDVVDAIAELQVFDATASLGGGAFSDLPLRTATLAPENLVVISSIQVLPVLPPAAGSPSVLALTVTNSNPELVEAQISGSQLVLTRLSGEEGQVRITVFATDPMDNEATESFTLDVVAELQQDPIAQTFGETTDLGGDWCFSSWLGAFNSSTFPWIFHATHEWLLPVGESPQSLWLFDLHLEWLWTSADVYPSLWSAQRNTWLWYQEESTAPRWFLDLVAAEWFSLD